MTPVELTNRLLSVIADSSLRREDRHKAVEALIPVLWTRIATGKARLAQSQDSDLVMAALPRLRALESQLTEALALEVELSIAAVWLQRFGGRITGVKQLSGTV